MDSTTGAVVNPSFSITHQQPQPMQPQPLMAPAPYATRPIIVKRSCKSNTRIVAYIDIAVSLIDIILSVVVIIVIAKTIEEVETKQGKIADKIRDLKNKGYTNEEQKLKQLEVEHKVHSSLLGSAVLQFMISISVVCIIARAIEILLAFWLLDSAAYVVQMLPEAVNMARIWLFYTIFSMILCLVYGGVGVHVGKSSKYSVVAGGSFLSFLFRLVGSIIVCKYVEELKSQMPIVAGGGVPYGAFQQPNYQPQQLVI